jgi:hypothetical protein
LSRSFFVVLLKRNFSFFCQREKKRENKKNNSQKNKKNNPKKTKNPKKKNKMSFLTKRFIASHMTGSAVILFLILYGILAYTRPSFLFERNGAIRTFGIGYKNKTILPLWLVACVLGILSYLLVLFYLKFG